MARTHRAGRSHEPSRADRAVLDKPMIRGRTWRMIESMVPPRAMFAEVRS